MTLSQQQADDLLHTYVKAWEGQDDELIVSIFTEDATYHERPLQQPIRGRDGIRRYWQQKVIASQRRISCRVLNTYIDRLTLIAEWEVEFDDLQQAVRKRMREVAILDVKDTSTQPLIHRLREYWTSEELGPIIVEMDSESEEGELK